MQLRFWGGWFLAIAGLVIMLSMGCEKGALGVKPAMVLGVIVRADNNDAVIPGATVRVMSSEAIGNSELKQGKNFLTTVTDANGRFVFDNVSPDNILIEYQKGPNRATYPQTQTSTDTAELEAIYVKSGDVIDLGRLALVEVGSTLPATVTIKLDLFSPYAANKSYVSVPSPEEFFVSVNDTPLSDSMGNFRLTAGALRDGLTWESSSSYIFKIRQANEPLLYLPYTTVATDPVLLSGSEVYQRIELQPAKYKLQMRWVNTPAYLEAGAANIIVETNSSPAYVLATQTYTITENTLPDIVEVSAISLPVNIRIQIPGYRDEVLRIDDTLAAFGGTEGNYRIDVDFLFDNGIELVAYNPNDANLNRAGMYDNIKLRPTVFHIAGTDLVAGDRVTLNVSLPCNADSIMYKETGSANFIAVTSDPKIAQMTTNTGEAFFKLDMATGYEFAYQIEVVPGDGSPTFYISKPDEDAVPVPETSVPAIHTVVVDAAK